MAELEISVEGGKYTYRLDRGRIDVSRFGEPWLDLTLEKGSKALIAVLFELAEARELADMVPLDCPKCKVRVYAPMGQTAQTCPQCRHMWSSAEGA